MILKIMQQLQKALKGINTECNKSFQPKKPCTHCISTLQNYFQAQCIIQTKMRPITCFKAVQKLSGSAWQHTYLQQFADTQSRSFVLLQKSQMSMCCFCQLILGFYVMPILNMLQIIPKPQPVSSGSRNKIIIDIID